jgi:phage tail-like protein
MTDDGYDLQRITAATFLFEVDGVEIGAFAEVSGLEVTIGVEELAEGGENGFVHKLPGRMTWPNLVLKRGLTSTDSLFAWLRHSSGDAFSGNGDRLARKSGAVTLLGQDGRRLRSWEVVDAFPVRWSGPSFAASSTEVATEELEIAHHGFTSRRP